MSNKNIYQKRLEALRKQIAEAGLDGYIVPRADEYQGEYCAPYAARLEWLAGFTGSAGTAIILSGKAVVLTDARYTIQVRKQCDPSLYETGDLADIKPGQWLAKNTGSQAVTGYDPKLFTAAQLNKIAEDFDGTLKPVEDNLIDLIWQERPSRPDSPVEPFPHRVAGKNAAEKLHLITQKLSEAGLEGCLLTLPDSLAWLLNIRGRDLAHTPVVLSYGLITQQGRVFWFIEPGRVSGDIRRHIGEHVDIIPPENMPETLEHVTKGVKIGLDGKSAPVWLENLLEKAGALTRDFKDPCIPLKTVKTKAEQAAIRAAHIEDGAALTRFLYWLERQDFSKDLSEVAAAEKLLEFRQASPRFRGESFPAIAGFGANGAIIHYRAVPEDHSLVQPPGLFLIDSGGQYEWGTTDITRTIAIGAAGEERRTNFTHVLKGHIALATAVFEDGTTGIDLDKIARAPLKEAGLDYAHGTGHGVGCYLSVHERGAGISPRSEESLKAGMLVSNEPGYYKEGEYGIRIENLVLVQKAAEAGMLGFETVSLAPIDRRLIVKELLHPEEITWLNSYHQRVRDALSPHLDAEEKRWLEDQTRSL